MGVFIIGAGGHGQVVADILLRAHETGSSDAPMVPAGFLDEREELHGDEILGLRVLGGLERLADVDHQGTIVAVGDNRERARLLEELRKQGETVVNVIHPSAVVAADVVFGVGVVVCAGAVVGTGSAVGDGAILNTGSTVDHHNRIGAFAHVGPGVHLGGDVRIGEGALVGIGASVIPGSSVGAWSVVGAGAVVVEDLPANITAVGRPAHVVERDQR